MNYFYNTILFYFTAMFTNSFYMEISIVYMWNILMDYFYNSFYNCILFYLAAMVTIIKKKIYRPYKNKSIQLLEHEGE